MVLPPFKSLGIQRLWLYIVKKYNKEKEKKVVVNAQNMMWKINIPWEFVKKQLTDIFKITLDEADSLITGLVLLKDGYISPELFVKSEMQNNLNKYIINAYTNAFSFRPNNKKLVRRSVGKSRKSVRKSSRKAKKSTRKAKNTRK